MIYLRILREVQDSISKWNAGFKRLRGYVDNIVVLLEILRHFKSLGRRIFITFTDIEKAFDSIDHAAIFAALRAAGASRKSIAIVRDIYVKAKAFIKVRQECGEVFRIGRGVLEGDVLSPLLFILAIEAVFQRVGADRHAPILGGVPVPQLGFADDIMSLSVGAITDVRCRFI